MFCYARTAFTTSFSQNDHNNEKARATKMHNTFAGLCYMQTHQSTLRPSIVAAQRTRALSIVVTIALRTREFLLCFRRVDDAAFVRSVVYYIACRQKKNTVRHGGNACSCILYTGFFKTGHLVRLQKTFVTNY